MNFSLTWLPEVLLGAGLKVAEFPGWQIRGRGDVGRIKGVICHHTAGADRSRGVMPSLDTLVHGRAATATTKALAGPLCQLGLARDGTWHVIAAGRANHAGAGKWANVTDGNGELIGIEAENTGKPSDSPWPDVQMDSYYRGVAAILKKIGASADMCCGHKEYALPPGRKPDPNFDMAEFREKVRAIMAGEGQTRPLIPPADARKRRTLRRGSSGADVNTMQQKLGIAADGDFGPITEAAVRKFQREHNLVPDGIVGPKSWEALDQL